MIDLLAALLGGVVGILAVATGIVVTRRRHRPRRVAQRAAHIHSLEVECGIVPPDEPPAWLKPPKPAYDPKVPLWVQGRMQPYRNMRDPGGQCIHKQTGECALCWEDERRASLNRRGL